jgi:hypothetical protein
MLIHELAAITSVLPGGAKGCFDDGICPRSDFCSVLRPVVHWPHAQPSGQHHYNRHQSIRKGRGRKLFLGGSDPTLSGLAAAQRLRRRRSLPPKLSTDSLLRPRQKCKGSSHEF